MSKTLRRLIQDIAVITRNGSFEGLSGQVLAEIGEIRLVIAERISYGPNNADDLIALDRALVHLIEGSRDLAVPAMSGGFARHDRIIGALTLMRRIALALGITTFMLAPTMAQVAQTSSPPTDVAVSDTVGLTSEDLGVMARPRPEFDPKGIPLGGFRLYPTMAVSGHYDDNVLRQAIGADDWFLEETPQVRVQSEWGRHFLEFFAGADNYNYTRDTRLDLTDWTAGSGGRYDISHEAYFRAAGSYGEAHEALSSPNTTGFQAAPNKYNIGHGEVQAVYQPGAIRLDLSGSVDNYSWGQTPLLGGGTLNNTDRDQTEFQSVLKASYEFSPGYSTFLRGMYDSREFDTTPDRTGAIRSSHGHRVDGGIDLQLTHLVSGEIYVGYLEQFYNHAGAVPLPNISGVDYSIGLQWLATPLLTVHLEGARTLSDVTITGVSAADSKTAKLGVDYELMRNVLATAYFSYTDSTFSGTAREDTYPGAGVNLRYLMNRYMSVDLKYDYNQRTSNGAGANFTDNLVSFGVNLHI